MRLSTKGRYGLRAMVDLATYSEGGPIPIKNIAERQDISDAYLEQVFSSLRKSGLIKSIKGPQGGYMLGDKTGNITVGQVLRVLEGELSIIDQEKEEIPKNSIEYCIHKNVWSKINGKIYEIVESLTLEDLAEDYKKMDDGITFMYYI